MVKVEKYIPISFTVLAIIADYMLTFVSLPLLGFYNKFKYACLAFIFLYIIYNHAYLRSKWIPASEKFFFLAYIGFSFLSSFLNLADVKMINTKVQALNYCGTLMVNFFLPIIVVNKGRMKDFIRIFLVLSFAVWIVSDVSAILRIYSGGFYITGTKFTIAYHHIRTILLLLIYLKDWTKRNNTLIMLLFAETFLIDIRTRCATGIVGTLLFAAFIYMFHKKNNIVKSPMVQVVVLFICNLFPFWYEALLNNSIVQYIVVDILGKDLTLTSRTTIYTLIPVLLGENAFWGYGIASNMEVCLKVGAVNIQNGMLKILMESGFGGMFMVYALYFVVFWHTRNSESMMVKAISAFLLVFSILSAIEISISITTLAFLLYLSVLYPVSEEKL